jgi:hypothetical protein
MDDLEVRDLFAMFAMCGFVVNGATIRDVSDETIAQYSYNMADAMIEARKPVAAGLPEVMKKGRK